MTRWVGVVLLLLVGGLRSSAEPAPKPTVDALASCGPGEFTAVERNHRSELVPEPKAPLIECAFSREVRCVPSSPTRSAYQMAPFAACPRTLPRWTTDLVKTPVGFSRSETRRHRLAAAKKGCTRATPDDGDCCYVQFSTNACD